MTKFNCRYRSEWKFLLSGCLAAFWFGTIPPSVDGQELRSFTVGKKFEVRVVDESQQPVGNAQVTVFGISLKAGGFAYTHQPAQMTDQDGRVDLVVGTSDFLKEGQEIASFELVISHPDHVEQWTKLDYSKPESLVTLESGCRFKLQAVDGETGEVIRDGLVMLSGRNRTADWRLVDDHWISPPLPVENDVVRLVQVANGQAIRFSQDLILRPESKTEISLDDVPLFTGVEVHGQLTGDFIAPVSGGQIAVRVVSKVKSEALPSWEWLDIIDVAEDGSFLVPCLPPDSVAGFLASAPGLVSRNPANERSSYHRYHQLHYLEDEALRVEIEMERTTNLKVLVVDEAGEPLDGAAAISQIAEIFPPELCFVGKGSSTRYLLWRKTLEWRAWTVHERYKFITDRDRENQQRSTNSQGEAIFNDVPAGKNFHVFVNREGFELEETVSELQSGQSHSITITLRRLRR
ncbi:MAG: hypothetical protein Q8M16_01220 [Pirellulaceae bacterium]|nr:hypothetical protein [Pirellulaceae bacterium]